jgi:hypothetical protein
VWLLIRRSVVTNCIIDQDHIGSDSSSMINFDPGHRDSDGVQEVIEQSWPFTCLSIISSRPRSIYRLRSTLMLPLAVAELRFNLDLMTVIRCAFFADLETSSWNNSAVERMS